MAHTGTHTRPSTGAPFAPMWANILLPRCRLGLQKHESHLKLQTSPAPEYASTCWDSFASNTKTSTNNGCLLQIPRYSTSASALYYIAWSAALAANWDANRPWKCSGQTWISRPP